MSIPGFLLLTYPNEVRKEEKLGAGGAGSVYSGVLLDKELISQHGTDQVALKHVPGSLSLTQEENKEVFLQEVSLMWFVSLIINFFLNI